MTKARLKDERCKVACATTWHSEHGQSCEGGPFPGTHGSEGDVRQCEHGRLWLFEREFQGYYFTDHDAWTPISKWLQPRLYRRALRAIEEERVADLADH